MLILLPVLLPVLPPLGIDLVHFGIIIIFNSLIGLITPPIGIVLSLASKIGDVPMDKAAVASLRHFSSSMLIVLIIITYVPASRFVLARPALKLTARKPGIRE